MQKATHERKAGEKLFVIIFIYDGGESRSAKLILKNSSVYLLLFHGKRYTDNAKADLLDGIKWKAMYHTKVFYWILCFFLFSSPFSFSNLGLRIFLRFSVIEGAYYIANYKEKKQQDTKQQQKNEEFNKYFLRNTTSAKNTRARGRRRGMKDISAVSPNTHHWILDCFTPFHLNRC